MNLNAEHFSFDCNNFALTSEPSFDLRYVNGKAMKLNRSNLLDQYFTKPIVAKNLFKKAKEIIKKYENAKLQKFTWLEPSAGDGVFFNLLPKNKRIGVDISPKQKEIIKTDYLQYSLPNKPMIVIGNPPFGHRGVTALNFINHSQAAQYVCFILPMFFESLGKGSIKYRVKNFNLIYSGNLPGNAFYSADKTDIDVKCIFQIWSKNHKKDSQEFSWYNFKKDNPFSALLDVYTVSLAKNRECGKEWIFNKRADYYLASTFYSFNKVVKTFDEVKYKSGIAIVLKTKNSADREKIKMLLETADWTRYSSLATNSCYHIGKSHIYNLLLDNGFNN
jgi:hypothetical protein